MVKARALLGCLVLVITSGCPAEPVAAHDAGSQADAGESLSEECEPGTMPTAGSLACQPVGWTTCPPGFERHPSGWGCLDVVAAAPCIGATREALGSRVCAPVGDCNSAFPPASATYFVDPGGATDATHFRTLTGAIAAAPSGAVIAIERGVYAEQITLRKSVSLVGRCAEQVVLEPSANRQAGLRFAGVPVRVEVSGLTVRGFSVGASVDGQSTLILNEVVFDANIEVGLFGTQGSTLRATQSVVRNTKGLVNAPAGMGVYVDDGVRVELSNVAIVGNAAVGVYLAAPPGSAPNSALIEATVIMGTRQMSRGNGEGLWFDGAEATVVRSLVAKNHTIGVRVDGPAARVTLTETVVRDTAFGSPATNASGAQAQRGAHLDVLRSSFVANGGLGVGGVGANTRVTVRASVTQATTARPTNGLGAGAGAGDGAFLELVDSVSVANEVTGVYVSGSGSTGTVVRSLVLDTRPNMAGGFGRGLEISFDAGVLATSVSILASRTHGVVVSDASFSASDLLIDGVQGQAVVAPLPPFGDGLAASRSTVDLVRPVIRNATRIALLYSAATGTVENGLIADNLIGIHFQQGSRPRELAVLERADPLTIVVTSSTRFIRNQTKTGSGEFALPTLTPP
jgi:hypothetical protein